MAVTKKSTVFWDVTLYSLVGVYQNFRGKSYLLFQGQRANSEPIYLLFGLAAVLSSVMSVYYQTTQRYIPGDSTLHMLLISCIGTQSLTFFKIQTRLGEIISSDVFI
jgi:hypothetical protein